MTLSQFRADRPLEISKHHFTRRSILPLRRDSLWHIEMGAVRTLTWLEDGTIITLGLWGPGDLVGQSLSKMNPYQIECITKVEATIVQNQSLQKMSEALICHIQEAEEFTAIRGYKKVDAMLMKFLNLLVKKFGRQVDKGHLIDLRLTHQDLADLLGTTRVTITRVFNKFEQQGLIHRFSHHRIILQEEEFWHYEI